MAEVKLEPDKVTETIELLSLRIQDRFPKSGLYSVSVHLHQLARDTKKTAAWVGQPNVTVKVLSLFSVLAIIGVIVWVASIVKADKTLTAAQVIQTTDSGFNVLIFLAVALYFLWTLDLKLKRRRIIRAINTLRELSHVIDMHQLTKDPNANNEVGKATKHSPARTLTPYELGRYLDYCAEMLSLISKLAYLYMSSFDDQVAANLANELETLNTGLSRKIWQKIMILRSINSELDSHPTTPVAEPPTSPTSPAERES